MSRFHSTLPFGAEPFEGGTRFRWWAPALSTATLEVEGLAPIPMQRQDDGIFQVQAPCQAGARYLYRIAEDLAVPDPASRAQSGGVHGASVVVDADAYRWRCPDWKGRPWHEMTLYELHAGCLGATPHGFAGVGERLPQIAQLGVGAVELMPIAEFSGNRNWGYDGVLPYAPANAYGTPNELKALIDTAHELGLCMILDVVYNHFGPDGNYLHAYAPAFFDPGRDSPWGASIDFNCPQAREFFIANAIYWLMEYRFDGLRLDAVHAIDNPGFVDELAQRVRAAVEPGRHVFLTLENENNQATHLQGDYDAQWNDDGHNVLHVLLTGEREAYYANYAEAPAEKLARCLAEGFVYQGEPSPSHGMRPRGTPSAQLPPSAFILFLQNHDQIGNRALGQRLTELVEPRALDAVIVLQLLTPQIPLLFMGEEWGARTPFLFFTDFHDALADAVRDGRRREFAGFSAFADDAARTEIPDPNDPETYRRSRPDFDEIKRSPFVSRWQLYRRLLKLRRDAISSRLPGTTSIGAQTVGPAAVTAGWRLGDGAVLRIACNLGALKVAVAPCTGNLLFESAADAGVGVAAGQLQGFATVVFLESPP